MRATSLMRTDQEFRKEQILSAQVGLLYANANLGIGVTMLAAAILGGLQWRTLPDSTIASWWVYLTLVSTLRFALAWRYRRSQTKSHSSGKWLTAFVVGAGLAGVGWGGAAILLYPATHPMNQVFLLFVLGGMMLGAASLLAPRPEAFLAFILPTGLVPAVRLLAQGDETHLSMGLLAVAFTCATLITTWRIYRTVDSSLRLRIENQDLVEDLKTANQKTEALNQALERRVHERTMKLRQAAEQLRAEIAQREQTEEELFRARKLESLGVLAGGIAHDFNNFLTVVQGNLEVAKMSLDSDAPAQEFVDQAVSACERAGFLSSQLLTFAKGGAPVRRVVSVAKLVTDAVQLAGSGSPIRIEVNIAEGLWFAEVDSGQIGQVFHNILLNARQAMPSGGTIQVRVENVVLPNGYEDADRWVRTSIRDSGFGMSDEILRRIFDPYFTTKPGGSGLGLATAYAIVMKHGGRIAVDSTPGDGTLFIVDLPASLETPRPHAPSAVRIRTGTERILLMDDEEALRILVEAVLSRLGYDVQTARDGDQAISLFEAAQAAGRSFDAALLDVTVIGGMGGIEAACRLKQLDPSLKLIVSSGYSDAPVMSHPDKYGFDDVIVKPWTVAHMSEVLRRVLAGRPIAAPAPPFSPSLPTPARHQESA